MTVERAAEILGGAKGHGEEFYGEVVEACVIGRDAVLKLVLTRADLASVRKQIDYWNNKVMQAEAVEQNHGRNRTYHFVYRDL